MSVVLADTSVWVAHFRRAIPSLQTLANTDLLLCHPLVILELACGTPPAPRGQTLADLGLLVRATVATFDECMALIESQQLFGTGCGAVDMALLASVLLTPDARLWTLDKKLHALALRLDVAYSAALH